MPKDENILSTSVRINRGVADQLKKIAFVNGTTQEQEITKAIETHVEETFKDPEFATKLRDVLAELNDVVENATA